MVHVSWSEDDLKESALSSYSGTGPIFRHNWCAKTNSVFFFFGRTGSSGLFLFCFALFGHFFLSYLAPLLREKINMNLGRIWEELGDGT